MVARVIDVFNQKGGVGKTTVVSHLAVSLGQAGQRVLVIDFDKQGNVTDRLLGYGGSYRLSANDLLSDRKNQVSVRDVALPAREPFTNVWVVPGGLDLLDVSVRALNTNLRPDAWFALERKLEPIIDEFDFVLIDNPPDISPLTSNGLIAAARWGGYLVPVDMHPDSAKGFEDIQLAIAELISGKILSEPPPFLGIVIPVLLKKKSLGTQQSIDRLKETFAGMVAPVEIPHSSRFVEAAEKCKLLVEVDPKGATWQAYVQFAQLLTGIDIRQPESKPSAKRGNVRPTVKLAKAQAKAEAKAPTRARSTISRTKKREALA